MKELAIQLRRMQLLAHNAHNEASGISFFSDHEFLGELYATYEEAYDSVVERIIGLRKPIDIAEVQKEAAGDLQHEEIVEGYFTALLEEEAKLCDQIEGLAKGKITQGTLNLLADIADKSEVRQYRLRKRLT